MTVGNRREDLEMGYKVVAIHNSICSGTGAAGDQHPAGGEDSAGTVGCTLERLHLQDCTHSRGVRIQDKGEENVIQVCPRTEEVS